jgi:hypothetical protein
MGNNNSTKNSTSNPSPPDLPSYLNAEYCEMQLYHVTYLPASILGYREELHSLTDVDTDEATARRKQLLYFLEVLEVTLNDVEKDIYAYEYHHTNTNTNTNTNTHTNTNTNTYTHNNDTSDEFVYSDTEIDSQDPDQDSYSRAPLISRSSHQRTRIDSDEMN